MQVEIEMVAFGQRIEVAPGHAEEISSFCLTEVSHEYSAAQLRA